MREVRAIYLALAVLAVACRPAPTPPPPAEETPLHKALAEYEASHAAATGIPMASTTSTTPPAQTQPAAKRQSITLSAFEGLYRAAKNLQGATAAGVTLVKFGEYLQAFATELSIVKDRGHLNEADQQLLAVFQDAYSDYDLSATLWKLKIGAHDDVWKGEIPIYHEGSAGTEAGAAGDAFLKVASKYRIPVSDHVLSGGHGYKAIPGDSPQRIWASASSKMEQASALYYGR